MTHHHIAQAERDAETARANLERTLDELRGRLTPGRVLDETLTYVREGSGAQMARNFGRQVKANPLPVALVGAGLAWLMLARRDSAGYSRGSDIETRYRTADAGVSDIDPAQNETSSFTGAAGDAASRLGDAASRMGDAMSSTAGRVGATFDSMADNASAAGDRLRRRKNDALDRASRWASKGSDRVSHLIETQPVLLGVLGLALGAVISGAFPGTRIEDRIAGKASDDLKRGARDTVAEHADKAMSVAERALGSAYEEGERAAQEEGLLPPTDGAGSRDEDKNQQPLATQSGA